MNTSVDVKTFCAAMVLALGCSREQQTTNTIAPADPRPGPTATASLDSRAVTTTGSPRPASALAPGTTFVTVGSGGIAVQRLLPRAHTAFHVQNDTNLAHEIVIRGDDGAIKGGLPPNSSTVLQLRLGNGPYEIACATPGHQERARFETYAPGAPLSSP